MKVSEITIDDLKDYCGLSGSDEEISKILLNNLTAAKSYIKSYCNLTDEEMDKYEDLTIAVLILVYDMFENRSKAVDRAAENPTLKTILGLHDFNVL